MASRLELLPTVAEVERVLELRKKYTVMEISRKIPLSYDRVRWYTQPGYIEKLKKQRQAAEAQLKLDAKIRVRYRQLAKEGVPGHKRVAQLCAEFEVGRKRVWAAMNRGADRQHSAKYKARHRERNRQANSDRNWRKNNGTQKPTTTYCTCPDPLLDHEAFCHRCGHVRDVDGTLALREI